MPPKKKETPAAEGAVNLNDELEQELAGRKLGGLVKLAENLPDMDVTCVSTGYPQLDIILHPTKKGLPLQRDVEIFSKDPEVGKTSIALEILHNWQQNLMRTAIADVERTITTPYLDQLDIVHDPKINPKVYAVRFVRAEDEQMPIEDYLDSIRELSQVMDLIVVDSVAALDKKANIEKSATENNQSGGISKVMSEFTRKNVFKRASIIWINQTRSKIGGYNPTGQPQYTTTGGVALPFFATIRLELSILERIKENDEVIGYKVQIYTKKNKIAPQDRRCVLTYLHGDGFSVHYDYYEMAMKSGIITKKGSWLTFGEDFKCQGWSNMVRELKTNEPMFKAIKQLVDGEDVLSENVA